MPAFYRAAASTFVETPPSQIVGALSSALVKGFSGDHSKQLASWEVQVELLQTTLAEIFANFANAKMWDVLFEYPLLRLQRRLDVVILAGGTVVVVEFKVGASTYAGGDIAQAEDYALDLRNFHEASHHLPIVPMLCATKAPDRPYQFSEREGVAEIGLCNSNSIVKILNEVATQNCETQIDLEAWDASPYQPVPSIIEAAELLFAGHQVKEIAHASTAPENLGTTTDRLIKIISDAQQQNRAVSEQNCLSG